MLALLTKPSGGKWTLRGFGPFVEEVGVGTKRKIASSVPLEAGAQVRPVEMLGRRFE
jgi:hypothetical protein